MAELFSALAAIAVIAVPMGLAWWLLQRPERPRPPGRDAKPPRGKMPR